MNEKYEVATHCFKKGEIWMADLTDRENKEQSGRRPVVVVQRDEVHPLSGTVTVVPLSSKERRPQDTHFWLLGLPCLRKPSVAKCEHVSSISKNRILFYIGQASPEYMQAIDDALRIHLNHPPVSGR